MTHAGKARRAGIKLILLTLGLTGLILGVWFYLAGAVLTVPTVTLGGVWLLFALFCINFFRDPEPVVPGDSEAIVSPGHGTVDVIDETVEKVFMGGPCRRISIFLSVFNVHVQNAPVAGRVAFLKHSPGQFVNAMRTDCSAFNENVLIGFESTDVAGKRVAVRLIAGLIARRIIPWIREGDSVSKGGRMSLIQFGSRVDLYLPLETQVRVKLGERVTGGETVVAVRS